MHLVAAACSSARRTLVCKAARRCWLQHAADMNSCSLLPVSASCCIANSGSARAGQESSGRMSGSFSAQHLLHAQHLCTSAGSEGVGGRHQQATYNLLSRGLTSMGTMLDFRGQPAQGCASPLPTPMARGGFRHPGVTYLVIEHSSDAVCLTCHRSNTARSNARCYQSAGSKRQPSAHQLIVLASQALIPWPRTAV